MAAHDFRQLATFAAEHFEARRRDTARAWRERAKKVATVRQRAAEAEAANVPFHPTDAERELLFNPTKGL